MPVAHPRRSRGHRRNSRSRSSMGNGRSRFFSGWSRGQARLGQLRRPLPRASKKVLTQHLRDMEMNGLIVRTDLSDRVPHVEYALSPSLGIAVLHLINALAQWSLLHGKPSPQLGRSRSQDDYAFGSNRLVGMPMSWRCVVRVSYLVSMDSERISSFHD